MRAHSRYTAAMLLAAAFYVGCVSLPDIRFVTDTEDAHSDAPFIGIDASKTDASSDGSSGNPVDAGPCGTSPGAGAVCCGTVWCVGICDSTNCNDCAGKGCSAGESCCGKMGTVQCKARCP